MKQFLLSGLLLVSPLCVDAEWLARPSGVTTPLFKIVFTSATTGFISGDGFILKTTDAGQTWTKAYYLDENGVCAFWGIAFPDSMTGYAAGYFGVSEAINCAILKTKDGGASWTLQVLPRPEIFYSIACINKDTCVAVGRGVGAISNGIIYRTIDAGETWSNIMAPTSSFVYKGICFPSKEVGYIVGDHGTILKSTDKGASWFALTSPTTKQLEGLYFFDADSGVVAGSDGEIFRTTDGGSKWKVCITSSIADLNALYFVDSTLGYAVGTDTGGAGAILTTTDGGKRWTSELYGVATLEGVYASKQVGAFVVGQKGTIAYSTVPDTTTTSVEDAREESMFILEQNYPNPVSQSSVVSCQLSVISGFTRSF